MVEQKTDLRAGYDETLQGLEGAWKKNPYMNESEFKRAVDEHFGKAVGKSEDFSQGARVAVNVFVDKHLTAVMTNEYNQSLAPAVGW